MQLTSGWLSLSGAFSVAAGVSVGAKGMARALVAARKKAEKRDLHQRLLAREEGELWSERRSNAQPTVDGYLQGRRRELQAAAGCIEDRGVAGSDMLRLEARGAPRGNEAAARGSTGQGVVPAPAPPEMAPGRMPCAPAGAPYAETARAGGSLHDDGEVGGSQGPQETQPAAGAEGPAAAVLDTDVLDRVEQWHGPEHPLVREKRGLADERVELAKAVADASEAELAQGKLPMLG